MEICITEYVSDEGTVVVFNGTLNDGRRVAIGVDHRCAQPIVDELLDGFPANAVVEGWQVLGTAR